MQQGLLSDQSRMILGNIFGLCSSIVLLISVWRKNKKGMCLLQCIDCLFGIMSCLVLGAYNGALANTVALTRNALAIRGKETKIGTTLLIIASIILGLYNMLTIEQTWYALFPTIAGAEYTTVIRLTNNYRLCKIGLLINCMLWVVYCFMTNNYVSSITTFLVGISIVFSILYGTERRKEG